MADQTPDASHLYSSPEDLERILFSLTQPDTEQLKRSTFLLKQFFKKKESVECLLQQIQNSQRAEVRQVAGVYLREQVEAFWKVLSPELQANMKGFLLQRLASTESRPERLSLGACIASIARVTIPKNEWNELLETLEQYSAPDKPDEIREVSMILWRNLVTYAGSSLKSQFDGILRIVNEALQAPLLKLQVEAISVIGAMAEFLESDEEVAIIRRFIPQMVKVIETSLKSADEQAVISGMGVFNDLMESDVPVLSQHSMELGQFMATICASKDLPLPVRRQGANFLTWMVKSRPKTVMKHELVKPLVQLSLNLVIESQGSEILNPDETCDGGDESRLKQGTTLGCACDLLDEIFLNIPSETCFPLAVSAIDALLPKDDAGQRKGAYVTMAMMAEGCAEIIIKDDNLKLLLQRCVSGITDPNADCRKCACEALTQFSTHLPSEIVPFHELIMPALFQLLSSDSDLRVKERALGTIEMFVENIEDADILHPYLDGLMQVLANCMNISDKAIQEQSLSTLSSVASTAKRAFVPYFEKVATLLKQILCVESEDMITLRAEATSCFGAVAAAVGRELFEPVMKDFHDVIMKGFEIDSCDIREHSFMYFGDLAELLGPDLLKMDCFRDMLDYILIVMDDDDGIGVLMKNDGFEESVPENMHEMFADGELEDDDDEVEGDDLIEVHNMTPEQVAEMTKRIENGDMDALDDLGDMGLGEMKTVRLQVTSGFMEEKAAAIHALTQFAKSLGPEFLKALEEIWEHIIYLWEYPHPLVKISLCNCIHQILLLMIRTTNSSSTLPDNAYNWRQSNEQIQYDSNVLNWITEVFPMYIQSIHDEEDRDSLGVCIDNFSQELRLLGPAAVEPFMTDLIGAISLFLKEKTGCFLNSGSAEEVDAEQVTGKHRWVADSIAELIGVLADLWGDKFVDSFTQLFPEILRYAAPNRHPHDQAMAAGCIADVASKLSTYNCMKPYAADAFALAIRIAKSDETNMRQNGLYLIGAMFSACDQSALIPVTEECLNIVNNYLGFAREGSRAQQLIRDNAVSALGKMMMSDPDNIPLAQYVPVWMQALPLSADFSENRYVYPILMELTLNQAPLLGDNMAQTIGMIAEGLGLKTVEDGTKRKIAEYFSQGLKDDGFRSIVSQLPTELQQHLPNA